MKCLARYAVLAIVVPAIGCSGSEVGTPRITSEPIPTPATPPAGPPFGSQPSAGRIRDCDGPATSLSGNLAAALPPRDGRMIPDDTWADLAKRVPGGFAGVLYVDGKPILMLTDPTKAAAAKQALAPSLSPFDVAGAEVRLARWDFGQLVDWYNYLIMQTPVWQTDGISSGDKDEKLNRIRFGVVDAAAQERLVRMLVDLQLPCDLVVVDITGRIRTLGL